MSEKYSLRIKIGAAEFEAEGPEGTVKDAFQSFLDAIEDRPVTSSPPTHDEDVGGDGHGRRGGDHDGQVSPDILERAFKVDKDRGVVSLKFLPESEGDQKLADAAILLIYGFESLLGKEAAKVTKLNDGIEASGLTKKRTDRYIDLHKGHYRKGGQRSGTRYSLTNLGEQWAEKYLRDSFAKK